ncbi:hypothetical protein GDO86_014419 [Hymenochirus boettgeri]|uniref:Ig-like domain-containing protein n=1 Tax=Hymenochirus boettgeri TaxID=247094 RepID=A0A8T2JUJ9_9PIPI|nr:hypothetical protein GDO86_014419 [Hymenochirus boettgeri]
MGNAAGSLDMFQARDSKGQSSSGTPPQKQKEGTLHKLPRPHSGELEERFNAVLKTCNAVLALNRMTLLSAKSDNNHTTSTHLDGSHENQGPPVFTTPLKDQTEVAGSTARFHCHIKGFPDPEVLWFHSGSPIQESRRFRIDYEETGSCSLV